MDGRIIFSTMLEGTCQACGQNGVPFRNALAGLSHFEQRIWNEKDRQRRVVTQTDVEMEVISHAGDLGISDIASVDVCESM